MDMSFYRDNLASMRESQVLMTAKQRSENHVPAECIQSYESAVSNSTPVVHHRHASNCCEKQLAYDRYNLELSNAVRKGNAVPVAVVHDYLERVYPEYGSVHHHTKQAVFHQIKKKSCCERSKKGHVHCSHSAQKPRTVNFQEAPADDRPPIAAE